LNSIYFLYQNFQIMANSMLVKITCLSVICMVLAIPLANADLDPNCKNVAESIIPCVEYITTPDASNPPAPCCNGMTSLAGQAQAVPESQAACKCLKEGLFDIPGLNLAALAALPENCGVVLPYQITPDMDCDKYISHYHPSFYNFIYRYLSKYP